MSNADPADFTTEDQPAIRPGMVGLIVDALAWGLALAILAFAVPKLETTFRDFGIEVGALMRLIIRASRLPLPFVGLAVGVLAVDSIVREALAGRKGGRGLVRAWSTLMIGLPIMTTIVMVATIQVTLSGFLHKLSG